MTIKPVYIPLTDYSVEDIVSPWNGMSSSLTSFLNGGTALPKTNGGDKTGDDRWYDLQVPIADELYDQHLSQLRKEGLIDD